MAGTRVPAFDWNTLVASKDHEIRRLNGIYRALLVNSGVTLLEAHARILDPHTVEVEGQRYRCERILIATGGWPDVPDFPGREHAITSNEAFYLPELPKRVVVVGGGYIAVEFASIFQGLAPAPRCCIAASCSCAASTRACASTCATRCSNVAMTCSSMPTWRGSTRRRWQPAGDAQG